MRELKLEQGEHTFARGRNGHFNPVNIEFLADKEYVQMFVLSRRAGNSPPIMLSLTKDDALKMAAGLLGWPEDVLERVRCGEPDTQQVAIDVWTEEDVQQQAKERDMTVTKEQAVAIVKRMEGEHDAEFGMNWGLIDSFLDDLESTGTVDQPGPG